VLEELERQSGVRLEHAKPSGELLGKLDEAGFAAPSPTGRGLG